MANDSSHTPLMAFILKHLRAKPDATFADVKRAAFHEGFDLQRAIVYGNARRQLGLAPMRKRPAPTTHRPKPVATGAAPARRRGNRPGISGFTDLAASLGDVVRERDQLRSTLLGIRTILNDLLG